MNRTIVFWAAAAILLSGACASKPETRKEQAAEGKEETSGSKTRTRYRELEGSSGYSSQEAEDQLEGD